MHLFKVWFDASSGDMRMAAVANIQSEVTTTSFSDDDVQIVRKERPVSSTFG